MGGQLATMLCSRKYILGYLSNAKVIQKQLQSIRVSYDI